MFVVVGGINMGTEAGKFEEVFSGNIFIKFTFVAVFSSFLAVSLIQ